MALNNLTAMMFVVNIALKLILEWGIAQEERRRLDVSPGPVVAEGTRAFPDVVYSC